MITALAHVIVTEGPGRRGLRRRALRRQARSRNGASSSRGPRIRPRPSRPSTGVPAAERARRRAAVRHRRQRRHLLRPGRDRARQGSTTVMGIANLAMATGNVGREGVGVNPLRGQNNVQGSCDMGSFPHELPGYRHVSDSTDARAVRGGLGRDAAARAGPAHPQHVRRRARRQLQGPVLPGRGHRAVRPEHAARGRRAAGDGMRRRAGHLPERDGQVRARVPAGLVVPREGRHLHQRRAPHLARAQGDAAAGRARRTGRSRCSCRTRSATRWTTRIPSQIMDEIARADADLPRRQLREASTARQHPVAVQRRHAPRRHADHARRPVRARQGPLRHHAVRGRPTRRSRASSRCC